MKKGIIGPAIVILVGILTLATAVTGVLYYTKKLSLPSLFNPIAQNSFPASQTASPIPSPVSSPLLSSPTPTADQATKWETYKDNINNFSIDYPSYLIPTRKATDPKGYISFVRINNPTHFIIVDIANPNDSFYSQLLAMIPGQKHEILTPGLWYERNSNISMGAGTAMFYDFEEVVPENLVKLSPPTAKYLDSKFVPGGKASLRGKNIFIAKNGLLYAITIDLNPEGDNQMEIDFNTMFATFKFTN